MATINSFRDLEEFLGFKITQEEIDKNKKFQDFIVGYLNFNSKNYDLALDNFAAALNSDQTINIPDSLIELYYCRTLKGYAISLFEKKEYENSLIVCDNCISYYEMFELDPSEEFAEVYILRAANRRQCILMMNNENFRKSIDDLTIAIKLLGVSKRLGWPYHMRGDYKYWISDFNGAYQDLMKAIEYGIHDQGLEETLGHVREKLIKEGKSV